MNNPLPRWRGFNLLDMYIYEPGRELIPPGALTGPGGYGGGEGDFRESDLQWIADWGFDFIRLPLDYRYWTEELPDGNWRIRDFVMQRIDRVLALGEKYGLHVSLSFHRAPGYCVNPPAESKSLWSDAGMRGKFCAQWAAFAQRYAAVPSTRLSFDLVNEPPAVGVMGLLGGSGMTRKAHEAVIRSAVAAIRQVDPQRLIIANGLNYGNEPLEELTDLPALGQSCRMYAPFGITHYQAPWVNYVWWKPPCWPNADHFGRLWGPNELAAHFAKWTALVDRGIGVHCGEGGAFRNTPHDIVLAWMKDSLAILKSHHIGWALWNFRGDFGVLDSSRADVTYVDWHGHQLDTRMLELLQKN
jgi:endoglucanase